MKYDTLIFDLDGTIIDSSRGIYTASTHALKRMGVPVENFDITLFIGPPLRETFSKFLCSPGDVEAAVSLYREKLASIDDYGCVAYDGIIETLGALRGAGYRLLIATSKNGEDTAAILRNIRADGYFDGVYAASMDGSLARKSDILAHLVRFDAGNAAKYLMIGDRFHDLDGAADNGIDGMGVLYGFGSFEELSACPHVYLADRTRDIGEYLIK